LGPDLVLIHGASANLRDFTFEFADKLSDRYRVIMVDRPGFGHSDPLADGNTSLSAQAARIRAALVQLNVKNPIVLGQSYGGAVALAWALDEPPAALVLVSGVALPWPGQLDPWYRINDGWVGRNVILPLSSAFVPQSYVRSAVEGVFAPQTAPEGYIEHLGIDMTMRLSTLATNVAMVNDLRAHVVAMAPGYPSLTLPVEIVHGDADMIVPLAIHALPLSKILPQANLTVLPGIGHSTHHTNAAEVIAAIDRAAARARMH
jgi:pimeloyl-ACP methyl ester carboxylesterase